jgi:hypothetical protein
MHERVLLPPFHTDATPDWLAAKLPDSQMRHDPLSPLEDRLARELYIDYEELERWPLVVDLLRLNPENAALKMGNFEVLRAVALDSQAQRYNENANPHRSHE